MTFIADVIIKHTRSMADIWRAQELDSLRSKDAITSARGLTTSERVQALRKHEVDAIKAHQSAIVLDMLANDLEDLKQKIGSETVVGHA